MTTREGITDEHRLIEQTAAEFMDGEVLPALDRLGAEGLGAQPRAGQEMRQRSGLLGTNVPETYGGVDLDKVSTMIVSEQMARSASFAVTFGAQANLTVLPIYMFGTDAQKQKYLPGLVAGDLDRRLLPERIGLGLRRPRGEGPGHCGSPTAASCSSGEKMWITNGGFADVYVVFAKVDGEQFTAFIVERGLAGSERRARKNTRWACTARRRRR